MPEHALVLHPHGPAAAGRQPTQKVIVISGAEFQLAGRLLAVPANSWPGRHRQAALMSAIDQLDWSDKSIDRQPELPSHGSRNQGVQHLPGPHSKIGSQSAPKLGHQQEDEKQQKPQVSMLTCDFSGWS